MRYFRSSSKLLLILSFALLSFSYTHAINLSTVYSSVEDNYKRGVDLSFDNYINKLFTSFVIGTDPTSDNTGPRNLEGLIYSYCASVLMNNGSHIKNGFTYSSSQSAFVYLLCKNIDPNFSVFFTNVMPQFTGYFKESDFDRLDLPVGKNDKSLAYLYADDLFNNIINEYFTIKQADVYGLQTDNEIENPIADQVNSFSSEYFNGIKICDTSQDLGKTFPKTCQYAVQYLRSAKKMFQNLNILSASGMYTAYLNIKNTDACTAGSQITSGYNIILCGLRGDAKPKSLSPFINLTYNELFYYNLFVQYFSMRLQKEPNFFKDSTMNRGVGTIQAQQVSRANEMKTELLFAKQALNMSVRMLRNAYVTYPIHIGFLMYRENLQDFGKALAKIATPVYTLFGEDGKFRKVQCVRQ